MDDIIGKATIHPILFYSGKISGYIIWILLFLSLCGVILISKHSCVYCHYISYAFLIIAIFLITISLIHLGNSTRLGLPTDSTTLKTSGIYRLSRNPMYLGFNLLTISSIVYSLDIIVIFLGIYSIIIYHFIIKGEESFLKKRFGSEYLNYLNKVRRYF